MSQRAYVELTDRGHEIDIHLTSSPEVMELAVKFSKPDVIICPFLKTAIPHSIWKNHTCIIIHTGIKGDRCSSSIDWAILNDYTEWGVTLLQADEEMDAGDIWSSNNYPMREVSKSVIYRHEAMRVAIKSLINFLDNFEDFKKGDFLPEALNYSSPNIKGKLMPTMKQVDRKINWKKDRTEVIARKIRSADSNPGVLDNIFGDEYYLFGCHVEDTLKGKVKEIIGFRDDAVLVGTIDGAIWISHVKKKGSQIKLPATLALSHLLVKKKELTISPFDVIDSKTYREIYYTEKNKVGYLHFDFYNGAMSTEHCKRLLKVLIEAKKKDIKVLTLMGGHDFWSNGIHLNTIESAVDPSQESWLNINAIDDIVLEIINTQGKLVITAMQGNAGAGGVILGLASDFVYAREGVVLNPHYKKMCDLYGSEYWTYLLPKRVGKELAYKITEKCSPIGTTKSKEMGLIDDFFGETNAEFTAKIAEISENLAIDKDYDKLIEAKVVKREDDEKVKPLAQYRYDELEQMKINFFGEDRGYHTARHDFVYKIACTVRPIFLDK
jgi:Methionyl-tRNA formyltransferase